MLYGVMLYTQNMPIASFNDCQTSAKNIIGMEKIWRWLGTGSCSNSIVAGRH